MSHNKIRAEKICLNCGTETTGHYCPSCGQKNIEPKQSVWHLIGHVFSDITHWDGKFFATLKDLFAKPGFLSKEYMIGRRMRYLDPIRMYIFTSAIFFLIFFSMFDAKDMIKNADDGQWGKTHQVSKAVLAELLAEAKNSRDSARILKKYNALSDSLAKAGNDTTVTDRGNLKIHLDTAEYATLEAYDSAQQVLPRDQRAGWLKRTISRKKIELNLRYKKEGNGLIREMVNKNLHNLPKVLFISLPFFAALLKLLYIRRKEFYYVDHGIFSVHLYVFSFIIILAFIGISVLEEKTGWRWLEWLIFATVIYPFIYYYKAMRRFYAQRRAKTILKYILLFVMSFIVYLTVFLGAILLTVFEV